MKVSAEFQGASSDSKKKEDGSAATQNLKSRLYGALLLTLFALALFTSYRLNVSLLRRSAQVMTVESGDAANSVSFRWHPTLYRLLSFGHVPSSVDWLLIRFLVDSNLKHAKNDEETEVFRLLNLATDLDPAFFELYTAGANFLAVARTDRVGARNLLLKGNAFRKGSLPNYPETFIESYWKERWRIPFTLGYVYLFEFQDLSNAVRAYAELQTLKGTPENIRVRAERIQTAEGQYSVGLNTLAILRGWYPNDPVMQNEISRKEQMFLLAKDLYFWNLGFSKLRELYPKRAPAELFEAFRAKNSIPRKDAFGGEIILNPISLKIDTRSEKIPVLGLLPGHAPNESPEK